MIRKTILCFFLATWAGTFPREVYGVHVQSKRPSSTKQHRDGCEVSPVSVSGLSPLT